MEVTTTVDGESRGSVTHEVTLTLPEDAAPTASCSIARTWAEGVSSAAQLGAFVQSRSGATFDLTGTAKYGATVVSWAAGHRQPGLHRQRRQRKHRPRAHRRERGSAYTYTVTDSRGLTRSYTGALMVLAWTAPQITAFSIQRVNSSGAQAVDGTCALASVQGSVASLMVDGAEKNSLRYRVQYRQTGTEAWTDSDEVATTAVSVDQSWVLQADGEDIDSFNDMQGYQFRLMLATSTPPRRPWTRCRPRKYGCPSTRRAATWALAARRGQTQMARTTISTAGAFSRGKHGADGVFCGRIGYGQRMDRRQAHLSRLWDAGAGHGSINIYRYRAWCCGHRKCYLRGCILATRCGMATRKLSESQHAERSYMAHQQQRPTAPSLRIIMGNDMSADAVSYAIEYTKAEDTPTYYWLPFLSSPNEEGCVLTASSEYSSGYQVEYAFNGLTSNYWACTNNDSQALGAGTNTLRTAEHHSQAGQPAGQRGADGQRSRFWVVPGQQRRLFVGGAGSYSGRSTAAGSVTTHSLNNSTGYKYLRISITSPGASSGVWTGFGDIRIEGEVA